VAGVHEGVLLNVTCLHALVVLLHGLLSTQQEQVQWLGCMRVVCRVAGLQALVLLLRGLLSTQQGQVQGMVC
jgi:hypothetical protein